MIREGKTVPGHPAYSVTEDGLVFGPRGVMTAQEDKDGYLYVRLHLGGNRYKKKLIHRLVWETYRGPIPAGKYVCHNDGTRDNADISNLRLDTQAGNCADKVRHGTHQVGEKHPKSKVSDAMVRRVRNLLASQAHYRGFCIDIAKHLRVSVHLVYDIRRGKRCVL